MVDLATKQPGTSSGHASIERPIDIAHLARMSLGDRKLEREVLRLFDLQMAMLSDRVRNAAPAIAGAAAHTIKGSARGIGAWRVARTAEQVEQSIATDKDGFRSAVADLSHSIEEARAAVAQLLRAN